MPHTATEIGGIDVDPAIKDLKEPIRENDGGKESPVTEESTKEPLKPLRGECRLNPSEPVVTTLVCFSSFAREAAGAAGTRHSLRPLLPRVIARQLGRYPRGESTDSCGLWIT